MTGGLEQLETMVGAVLAREELPTPERIRELITATRALFPGVTDEQAEELARRFETSHGVLMGIGATLKDEDFEPWLEDARVRIDPYYWDRYRRLLGEQEGFSGQVLATMDNVTDRTLGLLEDPEKDGKWDRRGMVVGHVQSGKTANYTALICKAADAGYKVVVVIAGIHNNLRNQTQTRIDEGFIGFDSTRMLVNRGRQSIVGAGRFDSTRRPNTFTNSLRDFDKATATSVGIPLENLMEPAVFVIKKNTHTLRNLIDWLTEHNAQRQASSINSPMLLIDDEADNASINIKGADEVSRINSQIRELLRVFERSCYVGYTATPFANIFIDPDTDDEMFGQDLFPKDFIVSLDPPDNYFGAERMFGDDGNSIIRHVDDNEDLLPLKHPIDHVVIGLPESLEAAVRTFVLTRAIRLARGQSGEHNSMLVNPSRFVNVQRQLRNEIHELVDRTRNSVRVNGAKVKAEALRDPEIAALHKVFVDEYSETCGISWSKVQHCLWESVSAVRVVEVNSLSPGSLNYTEHEKKGLNVIAVGGFSLSRGLTLQGLTVSYFLRNSMMYDTLMQMGRWFGYRRGYEDLCRVWMQEEAEGWYAHIAESIEELREELRRMESVNATPSQFGLKVRSHPDTLIVTARNKMGSSERHVVSVGLANRFIETAVLQRDGSSLEQNHRAAVALSQNLRAAGTAPENGQAVNGGRLVCSAAASAVINFLAAFRNHPSSFHTETGPVQGFIRKRSDDELRDWDILFAGIEKDSNRSLVDNSLGFKLICQRRSPGKRSDAQTLLITNRQRVASRGVEQVGLTKDQIDKAKEGYAKGRGLTPSGSININYPDRIFRYVRNRPLLIVHLLAIGAEDQDLSATEPVVAWSISFPTTEHEENKAEYVVNTTWFSERYSDEQEEEAEGDDN